MSAAPPCGHGRRLRQGRGAPLSRDDKGGSAQKRRGSACVRRASDACKRGGPAAAAAARGVRGHARARNR
ncbi:hypothetical protein SY87_01080 [Burkholderia pseudomallei]|nr:hypothetical protein SY87_01080 [Burkholderia pseudomallei]